jgi:hypothetical protein
MYMSPAVTLVVAIAWGVFVLWLIGRNWTRRRPGSKRPRRRYGGAMTAGAIYDLLNEDRRKALEIIVEQRAEAHDPEDRDGNLPEIEEPRKSG